MLRQLLVAVTATVVVWLLFPTTTPTESHVSRWWKPSRMQQEGHGEIIAVLTEFLGLLDTLEAFNSSSLSYPSPDTGLHPPGLINNTAASAAGHSEEAIRLMYSIPYLHDGRFQAQPHTRMLDYTEMDEDAFMAERIMLDYDNNPKYVMPASAIQITHGETRSQYGVWRIYDTEKSESLHFSVTFPSTHADTRVEAVHVWDYFRSGMKYHNYFEVPPVTPREAFQPIIDNYRSLKWLATGERSSFLPKWPYIEWPSSGKHPERAHKIYQADHDIWKAMRGLKDVYLDCGWNVHAVEQSSFRRDEFIEKKKRYMEDVVAPLRKAKDRLQAGHDRQDAAEKAVEEISGNQLRISQYGHRFDTDDGIYPFRAVSFA
jgi:hypothetical protein